MSNPPTHPPFRAQTSGSSRCGRGSGWGSGGYPTDVPLQKNPHNALIVLRCMSWGKEFLENFPSGPLCGPISEPSSSQQTVFPPSFWGLNQPPAPSNLFSTSPLSPLFPAFRLRCGCPGQWPQHTNTTRNKFLWRIFTGSQCGVSYHRSIMALPLRFLGWTRPSREVHLGRVIRRVCTKARLLSASRHCASEFPNVKHISARRDVHGNYCSLPDNAPNSSTRVIWYSQNIKVNSQHKAEAIIRCPHMALSLSNHTQPVH